MDMNKETRCWCLVNGRIEMKSSGVIGKEKLQFKQPSGWSLNAFTERENKKETGRPPIAKRQTFCGSGSVE